MPDESNRETKQGPNGHASSHPIADLSERASRLNADLNDLGGSVRELVDGVQSLARDQLRRQPYVAIAVAAGIGYVLGGGLPRGVLRSLLAVGGRAVLQGAVVNLAAGATASEPRR